MESYRFFSDEGELYPSFELTVGEQQWYIDVDWGLDDYVIDHARGYRPDNGM
jgi:hypothetical protein